MDADLKARPQHINSYTHLYNKMTSKNKPKDILHYPQLDTVLMVERFIKANSGEYKKRKLWESLPKKMMYQTFCIIFDYLEDNNKIIRDKDGYVVWIWDPEGVKRILATGVKLR